jgi:hypothetical protein
MSLENCDVLAGNHTVAFVFTVFATVLIRNPDTEDIFLLEVISTLSRTGTSAQIFVNAEAASHLAILTPSGPNLTTRQSTLTKGFWTLVKANAEERTVFSSQLANVRGSQNFVHVHISFVANPLGSFHGLFRGLEFHHFRAYILQEISKEVKPMAQIVEESLIVRFSQIVRNDVKGDKVKTVITDEHITTLNAALQEVLDTPAGVVVEVERQ